MSKILINSQSLDSLLANCFNDQSLSDWKVLLPKSNRTLYLHRLILGAYSQVFKTSFTIGMQESEHSMTVLDEDDDEQLVTEMFRSFYSGAIEIKEKRDIVPLLMLADKYKVESLFTTLMDHLVENMDSSIMRQCLHINLDLNNFERVKDIIASSDLFEDILQEKEFVSFDYDVFPQSLVLFVNNRNVSNAYRAVLEWIDGDPGSRKDYTYDLMDVTRKHSDRTPMLPFFEPLFCQGITLKNNNRRIKQIDSTGVAIGYKRKQFSVRLINVMIGMASSSAFGEYYCCFLRGELYIHGTLYNGDYYKNGAAIANGTVIGIKLQKGNLSFSLNGRDCGVAFKGLPEEMYPAIRPLNIGCEIEFCQTKQL